MGATEIGLVVNSLDSPIRDHFGDGHHTVGIPLTYIAQENPRGLAHAVKLCQPFTGDDPFIVYLGDNIFQDSMQALYQQFESTGAGAAIALTEVPDPSRFGVAELENGTIKRLVEKPKNPLSNLAIAGVYVFRSSIYEAIDRIKPSWRNEYEITDAIQEVLNSGKTVIPYIVKGWWIDAGKPDSIILANQTILEDLPYSSIPNGDPRIQGDSVVSHRVVLGEKTQIIDSVVRGPVVIGEHSVIRNAYVGPYTAIGPNVIIENCEIENSIVMASSSIRGIQGRIDASLIAEQVSVSHSSAKPMTHRFVLAENSLIELN